MLYILITTWDGEPESSVASLHATREEAIQEIRNVFTLSLPADRELAYPQIEEHLEELGIFVSIMSDSTAAVIPAGLKQLLEDKAKFADEQMGDGSGEPACGYPRFDETITDYARDVMEAVERLI